MGKFKAFENINERCAFIFIRIIEVSFSLLNDFKKGMIAKTETSWKPEMNLPVGEVGSSIFKLIEDQILMDSQFYFFRKTSIFNFAYRKTPEMG